MHWKWLPQPALKGLNIFIDTEDIPLTNYDPQETEEVHPARKLEPKRKQSCATLPPKGSEAFVCRSQVVLPCHPTSPAPTPIHGQVVLSNTSTKARDH